MLALLVLLFTATDCPGGVCKVSRPITPVPYVAPVSYVPYVASEPVERRRIFPNFQPFGGRFRPGR